MHVWHDPCVCDTTHTSRLTRSIPSWMLEAIHMYHQDTLQNTAKHCKTPRRTATHCNTPPIRMRPLICGHIIQYIVICLVVWTPQTLYEPVCLKRWKSTWIRSSLSNLYDTFVIHEHMCDIYSFVTWLIRDSFVCVTSTPCWHYSFVAHYQMCGIYSFVTWLICGTFIRATSTQWHDQFVKA